MGVGHHCYRFHAFILPYPLIHCFSDSIHVLILNYGFRFNIDLIRNAIHLPNLPFIESLSVMEKLIENFSVILVKTLV